MKKIAQLFIILFSFLFVAITPVLNKVKSQDVESASDYLTVTPPKVELWTEQGKEIHQTLKITNESDQPALIALSLESFSVAESDGTVVLGQNFSLPNDIISWIEFEKRDAHLAPKETKYISYNIKTPANAYPGGNYAAIIVSMDKVDRKPEDKAGTAKVVSLVLLSVAGDIRDTVAVEKYEHITSKAKGNTNHNFVLKLKNNGNNHIRPKGMIVITNFFGKKVAEVPLESENVLPNVSRTLETTWSPKGFHFGRYNANLVATYGYKGDKQIAESIGFFIWPNLITIVSIILALFIVAMLALTFKSKRR